MTYVSGKLRGVLQVVLHHLVRKEARFGFELIGPLLPVDVDHPLLERILQTEDGIMGLATHLPKRETLIIGVAPPCPGHIPAEPSLVLDVTCHPSSTRHEQPPELVSLFSGASCISDEALHQASCEHWNP